MRIGRTTLNRLDNNAHLKLLGNPTNGSPTDGDIWETATALNARVNGATKNLLLPSDFSITSQAQGDILYFNGTNWVRLAPGTSGQKLQTNGAAANPSWVTAGASSFTLVSTTTWAAGNSGAIALTSGRKYKAICVFKGNGAGSTSGIEFRINSNTTNGNYSWNHNTYTHDLTPTVFVDGDNSDGFILLVPSSLQISNTTDRIHLEITIDTDATATSEALITWQGATNGSDTAGLDGTGQWLGGTVTDFEIACNNSMQGTLYLYEMAIT